MTDEAEEPPEHLRGLHGMDLVRRATIPEYQVRWTWEPNSVAIWDNRCTQHYAVADYPPTVRQMQRAGVIGTKPVR